MNEEDIIIYFNDFEDYFSQIELIIKERFKYWKILLSSKDYSKIADCCSALYELNQNNEIAWGKVEFTFDQLCQGLMNFSTEHKDKRFFSRVKYFSYEFKYYFNKIRQLSSKQKVILGRLVEFLNHSKIPLLSMFYRYRIKKLFKLLKQEHNISEKLNQLCHSKSFKELEQKIELLKQEIIKRRVGKSISLTLGGAASLTLGVPFSGTAVVNATEKMGRFFNKYTRSYKELISLSKKWD
jgi:hypothetical protein